MRIIFISHFFPPKYNAGTENYTAGLASAFQASGHEVQVICAEDWSTGDNYWNGVTHDYYGSVPVHRIHINWTRASDPNRILYMSQATEAWFDQFLVQTKPDIVHITSLSSLGIGVMRSVRRAGLPLLLTLMDFWFLCPSIQLLHSDGHLCDGKTTVWQCQTCLLNHSGWYRHFSSLVPIPSIQEILLEKLAQIPLVTRQRGFRGMLLNMRERKRLLIEALDLPDRILSHSFFVHDMFAQHTSRAIEVLPLGHDLSWLGDEFAKTNSKGLRFGYIGQIQHTKGIHILVQAFQQASLGTDARLDIWGDITRNPTYVETLRTLINHHPGIQLRGRFERSQLATVLAQIDVLVVPSIWYENAPLVIQEAFAAKTPVITSNLGGMAEAVSHEVNGLLFAGNDASALAHQMQRLYHDPGLLQRITAGVPPVKRVKQEVEELTVIYQKLATEHATISSRQMK